MHRAIPPNLEGLLKKVAQVYELGDYKNYQELKGGLQALNVKVETDKGVYVVKVFSPDTPLKEIETQVKGLTEFKRTMVPVPELIPHSQGMIYTSEDTTPTSLYVTSFFEGQDFTKLEPNSSDLQHIGQYLARIHSLSFPIEPTYDEWGTANLIHEFEKKKDCLTPKDRRVVEPIVQSYSQLKLADFRQSIIHGDLQRQHVLKNKRGEHCVLDLGCMSQASSVIDLAICLAHFSLNPAQEKELIDAYHQERPLEERERAALPLLVQATYATYYIGAYHDIHVTGNTNSTFQHWLEFGRKGLGL
ncbi:MAG: phosphotransferase [Nanoarchaeota archaeon]